MPRGRPRASTNLALEHVLDASPATPSGQGTGDGAASGWEPAGWVRAVTWSPDDTQIATVDTGGAARGACCVDRSESALRWPGRSARRSDHSCEFVDRGGYLEVRTGVDTEFVVTEAKVLDERAASDHGAGAAVGLEAAHRSEPGLEAGLV